MNIFRRIKQHQRNVSWVVQNDIVSLYIICMVCILMFKISLRVSAVGCVCVKIVDKRIWERERKCISLCQQHAKQHEFWTKRNRLWLYRALTNKSNIHSIYTHIQSYIVHIYVYKGIVYDIYIYYCCLIRANIQTTCSLNLFTFNIQNYFPFEELWIDFKVYTKAMGMYNVHDDLRTCVLTKTTGKYICPTHSCINVDCVFVKKSIYGCGV